MKLAVNVTGTFYIYNLKKMSPGCFQLIKIKRHWDIYNLKKTSPGYFQLIKIKCHQDVYN